MTLDEPFANSLQVNWCWKPHLTEALYLVDDGTALGV